MIYTSYFGNWRKHPAGFHLVCVARWAPKQVQVDHKAIELAPSESLLKRAKAKIIDHDQYTIEFNKQLESLDPVEVGKKYDGCLLLCYEKKGDFCHRHLVQKWLVAAGIDCKELT